MDHSNLSQLTCQLYGDYIRGQLRYKGVVHDGEKILWEGKWMHTKHDAIIAAERAAGRIDRERRKRVNH